MRSMTVFCGSRDGNKPHFLELAFSVGKALAEHSVSLVYGGGSSGLMCAVADGVLDHKGKVIGVISKDIERIELVHPRISEVHRPDTMHERKKMMYDLGEGALILPGGIGSMDEFFEYFVWRKIGNHSKPLYLLNAFQFYDPLLALIQKFVDEGFMDKEDVEMVCVVDTVEDFFKVF
jgi:uncharacterized protein (TIGR00730 family)